jgi:hypothetical protein
MLANNPRNIRSFADFVNGIASRGAATAGLAAGPNIPQGYEQKAMGGSVSKRAQRNKHIESAAANLIQAGTQPDQLMKNGGVPNPNYIPPDDPRRAQNLEKFNPMKDKLGKPHRVFHNTNRDFSSFNTGSSELGAHFGTPNQAANLQANQDNPLKQRRTMAAYLNLQNPLRLMDQGGFSPERVAQQLFDMGLINEKKYDKHMSGDFRSEETAIKDLQNVIKKAGYDGVVYLNRREGLSQHPDPKINEQNLMWHFAMGSRASDDEFKQKFPEAEDSYIAFHPTQIKSSTGNQGTFDPTHPDITKHDGGIVRTKRATGGRIPEVDKMFKAAKKYVDSHTKPLLNAPDDAVVKALEVAKRRI